MVVADAVIDAVVGRLRIAEQRDCQRTIDRVANGVRAWAVGETLPAGEVEVGLARAAVTVARHGLDADAMATLGLSAQRVTEAVLGHAGPMLEDLAEVEREVCRRAVTEAYSALLADPDLVPKLQMAFQRQVLRRFDKLDDRPTATDSVDLVLDLPTPVWSASIHPPSALLRPQYRVVPFEGREAELSDLVRWCESDQPLGIRLYTGPGGMGKTRLAVELCHQMAARSWRVGFLEAAETVLPPAWPAEVAAVKQPLLVVVDYAETHTSLVVDLLSAVARRRRLPTRCILLARAAADWWYQLCRTSAGVGELLSGPATTTMRLRPVTNDPQQRAGMVQRAHSQFCQRLNAHMPVADAEYHEPHFDRVLFLHLAALAQATGSAETGATALLDAALRREQRFWDDGIRQLGLPALVGRPIAQCAALATLAGRIDGPAQAVDLLRSCPLLADQPAAVLVQVAELLHRLYPGSAWLEGVQPDLLGEHLVGQAIEHDPGLLGAFDAVG